MGGSTLESSLDLRSSGRSFVEIVKQQEIANARGNFSRHLYFKQYLSFVEMQFLTICQGNPYVGTDTNSS